MPSDSAIKSSPPRKSFEQPQMQPNHPPNNRQVQRLVPNEKEQRLLKLWSTNIGTVQLFVDRSNTFSAVIINPEKGKSIIKESDNGFLTIIGIPNPLKQSPAEMHDFLENTYVHGVPFRDSYKLYIHSRLSGGMKLEDAMEKSNIELSNQIQKNLPKDTYSAVEVRKTVYDFNGLKKGAVPTRAIILTLTTEVVPSVKTKNLKF